MANAYISAMDLLYRIAMWVSGISLLIMTLIIPMGIFSRYVMNEGISWPEPISIICMVTFTFVGAAVSYRACTHIAVTMLTDRLPEKLKSACAFIAELLMMLSLIHI